MSNIMLPNQNSSFWGYDLNNYLLSLNSKIESLESMIGSSTNSMSAQFNGFSFNGEDRWKYKNNKIWGKCVYGAYTSGKLYNYTHTFSDYEFLNKVYVVDYNDENKLSVPNIATEFSSIENLKYRFYAVYLFFERNNNDQNVNIKTLFCQDYIFREDCIMIGTYEKGFGFIPRVQGSNKTLYQNAQDTVKSYATVVMNYGNGSNLPTIDNFSSFVLHSNGVGADKTLTFTTEVGKDTILEYNTDIKNGDFFGAKIENAITVKENDKIFLYYLSPSGNIYKQEEIAPPITTEVKDYNIESSNPLSQYKGYRAGGLVFLGAVVNIKEGENNFYQWVSAKQNGVSPIITTIDNENFNNILIENNKYWIRESGIPYYYRLSLTPYGADSDCIRIIPKVSKNSGAELNIRTINFPSTAFNFGDSVFFSKENYSEQITIDNSKISIFKGTKFELDIDNNNNFRIANGDNKWIFNSIGCFETKSISIDTIILSSSKNEGIKTLEIDSGLHLTGSAKIDNDLTVDNCLTINNKNKGNAIIIKKSDGKDITFMNDDGISTNNIKCNNIEFISDIRLKTNLKPIDSKICYDAVQKLNVNKYTYIKNNYNTLGLIAQEIEEYLPEYANLLVSENEEGEKMVSEHKLLFILWEALKYEISERKKMGGN